MKKFINFAVCCLWVLGTIGGIGYALYEGAYPTVKKHFNELTE